MKVKPVLFEGGGFRDVHVANSTAEKNRVLGTLAIGELIPHLARCDVHICEPGDHDYDAFLLPISDYKGAVMDMDKPFILNDHRDSGSIMWRSRKALMQGNVIGMFTPSTLRNPDNQNALWFDETYQGALLYDTFEGFFDPEYYQKGSPSPFVDPEVIKQKVRLSFSYGHGSLMKSLYNKAPDWDAPRPRDVFFAGTTYYRRLTPTLHRWACITELNKYAKAYPKLSIEAASTRKYGYDQYLDEMKKSKIVVAPWGFGERTFREWEAHLCGCSVVRPNTDWATTWPDINESHWYTACCPCFSNLAAVLDAMLETWDETREQREHHWNTLKRMRDPKVVAAHLAESFHHFGDSI